MSALDFFRDQAVRTEIYDAFQAVLGNYRLADNADPRLHAGRQRLRRRHERADPMSPASRSIR